MNRSNVKRIIKKSFWFCCTCFIFLLALGLLKAQPQEPEHDPLEYEVQVNAQIIPIYAVDSKGNPVYDLKAGDIELYINGKPKNILYFTSYQVEEEVKKEAAEVKTTEPVQKQKKKLEEKEKERAAKVPSLTEKSPERLNFVILDGIANSKRGVRNARKLARGLVKSGSPGDAFILFTANVRSGLQYVTGPEKNKTKLLQTLDKIYQDPRFIIMMDTKRFLRGENPTQAEAWMWASLNRMYGVEKIKAKGQYEITLRRFSRTLKDLKYALKTIRLPKNIFLVSGAVQEIASVDFTLSKMPASIGDYDQSTILAYYGMMKNAAIAINRGGALFYMINPIPEVYKIRKAVNIMSQVSNAKCISASNVDDLLKKVKKNTAAYYEAAFSITPQMAENFKIKIKCKRKGVKLNTLNHGEKIRAYAEMDETMKKLFALNVVTGGSWSRMLAKIRLAKYQKLGDVQHTDKKKVIKKINLLVPRGFKDRKVDIFVLNINPKTLKADIRMSKRVMDSRAAVEVEVQEKRKQFIVLVEPGKTHCIFNRVL